jgi:hypothetical protein
MCPLADLLARLDRSRDLRRIRPEFESLLRVVLQAGLTVGGDRRAHGDEFLDPVVPFHDLSPPGFFCGIGGSFSAGSSQLNMNMTGNQRI